MLQQYMKVTSFIVILNFGINTQCSDIFTKLRQDIACLTTLQNEGLQRIASIITSLKTNGIVLEDICFPSEQQLRLINGHHIEQVTDITLTDPGQLLKLKKALREQDILTLKKIFKVN